MGARITPLPIPKLDLGAFALDEVLDADPRPTFVLDLTRLEPIDKALLLTPSFCNRALSNNKQLLDNVVGLVSIDASGRPSEPYQQFRQWIAKSDEHHGAAHRHHSSISYAGTSWTTSIIRDRYQIVCGNYCEHVSPNAASTTSTATSIDSSLSQPTKGHPTVGKIANSATTRSSISPSREHDHAALPSGYRRNLASRRRESTHFNPRPKPPPSSEAARVMIPPRIPTSQATDWTAADPQGTLSPHEIFARNTDWASTPLGPMSSWTAEFREVTNLVMRNPHPAALFWGEELTMVYNEPYRIEVAGNKHPSLMGSGFFENFRELWEGNVQLFRECAQTGESIRMENDRLLIERYGYLEETFFSWSFVPLYGGTDRLLGFYNAPFETTYQTVSSRRMGTLRHLGERIASVRSVKQFWRGVLTGLEFNGHDITFATVYSMGDSDGSDAASVSSGSAIMSKSCVLEGTIGVPVNHPTAPPSFELSSQDSMAPSFREAMHTREPVLLRVGEGNLPETLFEGIDFQGFGIPSKEALIIPVRSTSGQSILALLMIGLNPRRRYDQDYQTFIAMLNRQMATSLAAVLLLEDEARKNRTAAELAELQREKLTEQLALQESRLRRMTEFSPLGMFLISPDGVLLEANDRYYEMTNHSRDNAFEMSFMDTVADLSKSTAMELWQKMTVGLQAISEELQLSNNYNTEINEATGAPIDCWALVSALPEIGQDGQVRSVMGSITDVSHQKWAQTLQDQRLREAEETKRQQNSFIDITSHEMRNPLSAVLICADDIRESLTDHPFAADDMPVIQSCVEAANTIALCVQHQKSIVDDILTISKLNSHLLVISPVATQPVQVLQQAMNMFKNEAQSKSISLSLHVHPSLTDLDIRWAMLDPGRLLQIVVNLITNAIKFTQQSRERSICVHVGASRNPPIANTLGLTYVPTREPHIIDITAGDEWGTDELIFIRIKITDTGCGLTEEEKQRLFERFAQASPRTHAQYGGSGLGLFISRQLAELHGGQIGAASVAGRGSTFGFFLQCRRTTDPAAPKILRTSTGTHATPQLRGAPMRNGSDTQLLKSTRTVPLMGLEPIMKPLDPASLHVLIVEDNLVNQKLLKKQLEKIGCMVDVADNGLHALRYLENSELYESGAKALSVILMDLEMPEMDGLSCVARIRELEADGLIQRHVPVIAVTANVRAEQMLAARNSGMDDIVSKPFRIAELMERIQALLRSQSTPRSEED